MRIHPHAHLAGIRFGFWAIGFQYQRSLLPLAQAVQATAAVWRAYSQCSSYHAAFGVQYDKSQLQLAYPGRPLPLCR